LETTDVGKENVGRAVMTSWPLLIFDRPPTILIAQETLQLF
jgi:hypothetical protein